MKIFRSAHLRTTVLQEVNHETLADLLWSPLVSKTQEDPTPRAARNKLLMRYSYIKIAVCIHVRSYIR